MQAQGNKEYLEKILALAVGGARAPEEAEKLINTFSSASDLANTSSDVMQNLSGCSEQTADFVRLLASLSSRRITDEFKNGRKYSKSEIERYVCALLFHLTVESVYMISLDKSGKLISTDLITEGTVNSSAFLPRKLVDIALKKRAASVILAHNHPSGNPMPSDNDISVTLLAQSVLNDAHVTLGAHYITVGFCIFDCLDSIRKASESDVVVSKINPLA